MDALRILHLEDNLTDAELLESMLRNGGIASDIVRVDTEPDFLAALDCHKFDLILSDFSMPRFSGRFALNIARERCPEIPFIFVSGTIGEEAAVESLRNGATDYVLKHKFARLVPAIERAHREAIERKKRKQAERELEVTSTQLRNLFENLDDVLFSFDAIGQELLQLSSTCEDMSGWPSRVFFDQPFFWWTLLDEEGRARITRSHADLKAGRSVREELEIIDRNGGLRWIEARLKPVIDAGGRLARIDGVLSDITDRKLADEALQASETRYRQLFEGNPHPMWVVEAQHLRFMAINNAAIEQYGYSRDEFLGMTIDAIECPGEAARHKRKDGTFIDVDITSHDMIFEGRAARLVLAQDVTEKKRTEAQLLRSQRMESIGTLAGGIAHDLNNVLAPILMAVQLFKERLTDASSQNLLEIMETSAKRGAGIVRQVLTFARGSHGERVAIQLKHLFGSMERMLRETFPKSITIETEIPNDLWIVHGDPTQVDQLLLNLCVNARDAMPSGGTLRISAANRTLDQHHALLNVEAKAGPYIAIEVADTGEGIPPGILEKIFDPFFTTKEVGKGTGLGLSTVRAIAKSHGGFVNIHSKRGKGTRFSVYLPAKETVADAGESSPNELPVGHGELILLVDDEAAVRDITKVTLESFHYRVITASNGAEAVAAYAQKAGEVKVVVLDMMMPVMDGAATIRALESMDPEVKIILASGLVQKAGEVRQTSRCVKALLEKPYAADKLLNTLSAALVGI